MSDEIKIKGWTLFRSGFHLFQGAGLLTFQADHELGDCRAADSHAHAGAGPLDSFEAVLKNGQWLLRAHERVYHQITCVSSRNPDTLAKLELSWTVELTSHVVPGFDGHFLALAQTDLGPVGIVPLLDDQWMVRRKATRQP